MNPKLTRRLPAAAAIIFVAFAGYLVYQLYQNMYQWSQSERRLQHYRDSLRTSEEIYTHLTEAQSAVRRFIITADPAALKAYSAAVSLVDGETRFLNLLLRTSPRQRPAVEELNSLLAKRKAGLAETVLLRRSGPAGSAAVIAALGKGDRLTNGIRRLLDTITDTERDQFSAWQLQAQASDAQKNRLLTVFFLLLFISLLVAFSAALNMIRKRRLAEDGLTDLKLRLQSVLDSATQLSIIATDLHGSITVFSAGAEKMLGYKAGEVLGKTPEFLHLSSEVAAHGDKLSKELNKPVQGFEVFVALARGGSYERKEWTYIRKEGSRFPVELTVTPLLDHKNNLAGFLGLATDITVRKHSQLQMRKLSAAIKSSPTSIVITDRDGHIEYANPKFFELTGYTELELMGQNPKILNAGKNPKSLYKELWDTILQGRTWEGEFLNRKKNGELFWEHAAISPVKDPQGEITNFVAVKLDITDRKLAAKEMEKARNAAVELARLKSEFLANMSHEIRTPMNAIIGMTGLLLDTELSPRQSEYVKTVGTAGEALLDIINDILDFSKIESGKILIETLDFDLQETVESAADLLAPRAQSKDIELLSYLGEDVPCALRGDQGRLRQVLINLLGNAIKFTARGEVALKISLSGGDESRPVLRFEIRDTGIGISEKALGTLFGVFTQADSSTTRKYGGTGLGLSISKRLVELMGGAIGVESQEGWGSLFWFTLPFDKQPGTPARQPKARLLGVKCLIVDDNTASREIAGSHLRNWGLTFGTAASAQEALAALRSAAAAGAPYQVLLTDMQMPGTDGLMLARAIQADPAIAGVPKIMMTSLGQDFSAAERAEAGLSALIHKPLRPSALLAALNTALGAPAPAAQPAAPDSRQAPARKKRFRVLVAEDNAVNQKVALRQLEKLGYEADVAANGLEAVAAIRRQPYDLVLMDCQMPEMDGFQATAEIRKLEAEGRRTPIVAMTAHALQGDQDKCLASGMDGYISKPVRLEVLADVLRLWDSPLDSFVIKELRELGGADSRAFMAELAGAYLKDLPGRLEAIRAAARTNDRDALRLAAHALKGSSANMGAKRLQKLCLLLEDAARSGSLQGVAELLAELEGEAGPARAAVEALGAPPPGEK
jgi:PAS domain S-box-containing protein